MTQQPPEQRAYYHEAIEKVLAMRKIDLANAAQHPSEKGYYWGRAHRCDDILFWLHIQANIAAGVPEQPPEVPQREHERRDTFQGWQAHVASLAQRETRDNPECFCPFCQAYLGRFYSNKIVMVRDDESVQAAFRSLAASQKMENSHLYENEAQSVAQREEAPKPPADPSPTPWDFKTWGFYCDKCRKFFESEELNPVLLEGGYVSYEHKTCNGPARYITYERPAAPAGTSQGLEAQITERLEDSRSSYDGEATVNWNEAVKEICAFIRTHDAERERSLREKLEGLAAEMKSKSAKHGYGKACAQYSNAISALLVQQREPKV